MNFLAKSCNDMVLIVFMIAKKNAESKTGMGCGGVGRGRVVVPFDRLLMPTCTQLFFLFSWQKKLLVFSFIYF